MEWLDATLIEPVWQGVTPSTPPSGPTNPSSLVLALIGVGTLLILGFGRRSRSRRQNTGTTIQPAQTQTDDRRAA